MILAPPRAGLFFAFCISKSHHENRGGSFHFTANFADAFLWLFSFFLIV